MAYSKTLPPQRIAGNLESTAPGIWVYANTDAVTAVRFLNYFTNALDLGMRAGDLVIYRLTSTNALTFMTVMAVTSAGADLSDGLAVGVTNTD